MLSIIQGTVSEEGGAEGECETDGDGLYFDFSPAHCAERGGLWEERGLSNRFPVSTAQSLRHHSIVCFTTQFFRHCLAARPPPLCRSECADDAPEKEIELPGFKISVDIVWVSSPQHLSVRSSRLLRIFLSHRPGLSCNHPVLLLSPYVFLEYSLFPHYLVVTLFSPTVIILLPPLLIFFPLIRSASFLPVAVLSFSAIPCNPHHSIHQVHMSLSGLYIPPNMSSRGMQVQNTSPVKSYLDAFVIVTTISISINLSIPVPKSPIWISDTNLPCFLPISYSSHTPEILRNPWLVSRLLPPPTNTTSEKKKQVKC